MNNPAVSSTDNEIILYRPDSTLKLEVRIENETVWLTQQQMSELFERNRTVITRHINNIFKEGELDEESNVQKMHIAFSDKPIKLYSLDIIISVGYRVKSVRGTQFRQWANKVLKDYLLRGYSINQRIMDLEGRMDRRFTDHDKRLDYLSDKVDFFIKTSVPPREGVFFNGQIFDAYALMCDLVRTAKHRVIMIDNYIDETVFRQLNKRGVGVNAVIYTSSISSTLKQDLERHNAQYPVIEVKKYKAAHDRFLIIDDTIYHVGASFKDLGKKLFAFSRMEAMSADEMIARIEERNMK